MKTIYFAAFLFLFTYCFGQSVRAQETHSLRMMTYNIRNGKGMDDKTDLARTAKVINQYTPDVVALQEVDSVTHRSGGVDVMQVLAEQTGMRPWYSPAIDFDGGKYGIGILSKQLPKVVTTLSLPGREEKRTALILEFQEYIYICTHLSLNEEDRFNSLLLISEVIAEMQHKPVFLAGDLNARPGSDVIKELEAIAIVLNDMNEKTFPADNPRSCIDYIAVFKDDRYQFKTKEATVVEEPVASDHRPVFVAVEW